MNVMKLLWSLINGKKFNTGTLVILAVMVFQSIGIDKDTATQIATNIMLGIGGLLTLVGYVHRIIKSKDQKKE